MLPPCVQAAFVLLFGLLLDGRLHVASPCAPPLCFPFAARACIVKLIQEVISMLRKRMEENVDPSLGFRVEEFPLPPSPLWSTVSPESKSSGELRRKALNRFVSLVLQTKFLEDGRNLLMHAAFVGAGDWFRHLVKETRARVRILLTNRDRQIVSRTVPVGSPPQHGFGL